MGKLRHRAAEPVLDTLRCPWSKLGHSNSEHPCPCGISSPWKGPWAPDCSQNRWNQELAPTWGQAWLALARAAGKFGLPEAVRHR